MDLITIVLVALGLAMDAFAVSIANGIVTKARLNTALKLSVLFGSFQAFMPVAGWLAGLSLADVISGVDHWIAFALLSLIGAKMIYESMRLESAERRQVSLGLRVALVLSVATSIDALAVGLSFSLLGISIVTPVAVIGAVTFALSFIGVFLGNRVGHLFENKIGIVGGLVLIGIGLKILLEHSV